VVLLAPGVQTFSTPLGVVMERVLRHLEKEENCNIGYDGCVDCIGMLNYGNERWAEEVIERNLGEVEKK
jgi:hypothetical protein